MISLFLYIYFWIVKLTSRFQIQSESDEAIQYFRERKPAVYSFWFEKIFLVLKYFNSTKPCIHLTPLHKWDTYTFFATLLGIPIAKGSLESGGRHSLLTLIEHLNNQHPVLIAADSARGPEKKIKTTGLILAQETKTPLIPIGISAFWGIRIKVHGNRVYIPLPFNSFKLELSVPVEIKQHLELDELDGIKNQISNILNDINS